MNLVLKAKAEELATRRPISKRARRILCSLGESTLPDGRIEVRAGDIAKSNSIRLREVQLTILLFEDLDLILWSGGNRRDGTRVFYWIHPDMLPAEMAGGVDER